ncbi:MAG TPA: HD-GYP domain-containing protein, partial [Candidatus Cloacimonetes bacterium]|nr:HD-GYP domain-containing protein [Candidatus Cloacimonadota bacterium]
DDKNAFKYFKLYSKIKDEIFTEESNKQIALLQTIYETEKKEKEAEIYKLKNVELAEANREIQQKNKELNIHREHLEEIVRERTKELISSNKQLKREIHEHKLLDKALQKSNERLKKLLEETVNGLVSALEIRDPYTAGHQKRVAILANAIAKSMKLSQEQIDGIRISATLHDIGKMEVPGEILSKPGKLSDIQFSLIKNHPQAGYEILKSIEFPWPVAKIVYQHHEKLNGSGYPQGLSGDEIILEAKILCVADVVEAMASHRPYRPARGIDATLEEIQKNKRILYDPEVVDVCYRLFKNKGFNFHE